MDSLDFLNTHLPAPAQSSLDATSSAMKTSCPAFIPVLPTASSTTSMASRFDFRFGAKPPSSPTPVDWPRALRIPRSAWKISAPACSASANEDAPTGIAMKSWKSTLVSAWAPPFKMFIIGTGSVKRSLSTGRRRGDRETSFGGSLGVRDGHRRAKQRVGAEAALGRRAVERDERLVERPLRMEFAPDQRLRDLAVDVRDRPSHALAAVARLVAVPQFERLALTRRGARWHRRPAAGAVDCGLDFYRRVPARIQNLAPMYALDVHGSSTFRLPPSDFRLQTSELRVET